MLQAQFDWPFGLNWTGLVWDSTGLVWDWAGLGLGLGLGSTIEKVQQNLI